MPAEAGRKPTQVRKELAQEGRADLPGVRTPSGQVRIDAPYHSTKEPFFFAIHIDIKGLDLL